MFIGAIGCGKTSFIQKLNELQMTYNKTKTIEFYNNVIDTPGEYVEHRAMYSNLMTIAIEADVIVLMQSATDPRIILPTGFSTMFTKETIGVVTKTDIATNQQIEMVTERLRDAGAEKMFEISTKTGANVQQLIDYLRN